MNSLYQEFFSQKKVQVWVLLLLSITLFFSKLEGDGLATFDDAYYAQKAKEILQTGDWLTLHYMGGVRHDNPPLFMSLVALSYKVFGVNEYAAKFPSALLGVGTVLLIFFFANRLFGPPIGFLSALVLTLTQTFIKYSRHAMIDVTMAFYTALALWALYMALKKNRQYFYLWGLAISLGILSKSILGFYAAFISVLFLLFTKNWKVLRWPSFWGGVFVVFAFGCSWYYYSYIHFGWEFIDHHFLSLIMGSSLGRGEAEPWYSRLWYFQALLYYYWPWLPFFIWGCYQVLTNKNLKEKREESALVLIWGGAILGVMSLMSSQKTWYITPMFPAFAIVSAMGVYYFKPKTLPHYVRLATILLLLSNVLINATPLRLGSERSKEIKTLSPYVKFLSGRYEKIYLYKKPFYEINNVLLFYSDAHTEPTTGPINELKVQLTQTTPQLAIVQTSDLEEVKREIPNTHLLKRAGALSLISNQSFDFSTVNH